MDFLTTAKECAVEKFQSVVGFSIHQNLKESLDHYLLELSEKLLNNYSSEVRFILKNRIEVIVVCYLYSFGGPAP